MKYLFIILMFFSFAQPALAARVPKGTVPYVEPLQKPDAFVKPNVSGNIESKSEPAGPVSSSSNLTNQDGPAVQGKNSPAISQTPAIPYGHANLFWIYFIFIVFGGLIIYKVYSRFFKKR